MNTYNLNIDLTSDDIFVLLDNVNLPVRLRDHLYEIIKEEQETFIIEGIEPHGALLLAEFLQDFLDDHSVEQNTEISYRMIHFMERLREYGAKAAFKLSI